MQAHSSKRTMAATGNSDGPSKRICYNVRTSKMVSMETCLMNALVDLLDKGKRAKNGVKKESWKSVYDALCEKFLNINFTMKEIK